MNGCMDIEKMMNWVVMIPTAQAKQQQKLQLKVGDQVLYGKYAGTDLQHEGSDYLIMKESDILAIV